MLLFAGYIKPGLRVVRILQEHTGECEVGTIHLVDTEPRGHVEHIVVIWDNGRTEDFNTAKFYTLRVLDNSQTG